MRGWQLHTYITLTCGRCGYVKRDETEIDLEGDYSRPDIPRDWREVTVTNPSTEETWSYQFCPTCSFELSEFVKDGTTTPTKETT